MDLFSVVKKLYPNLSEAMAKRVVGSLKIAGCGNATKDESLRRVVSAAVEHHKEVESLYNPLRAAVEVEEAKEIGSCPICSQMMTAVTLLGDVEATYCNVHNVVYPVVKNE